MLKYKENQGYVEFDPEENVFVGKVFLGKDIITYVGSTLDEVEIAFEESIMDYFDFKSEIKK